MTTETNRPDWLREGNQVAEYNGDGYEGRIAFATIVRITATQVVLDTGRRYRLDGDRRQVGEKHPQWRGRTTLEPLHSTKVRNVFARKKLDSLVYEIDQARRVLHGGEGAVLSLLAAIERKVATARALITSLSKEES